MHKDLSLQTVQTTVSLDSSFYSRIDLDLDKLQSQQQHEEQEQQVALPWKENARTRPPRSRRGSIIRSFLSPTNGKLFRRSSLGLGRRKSCTSTSTSADNLSKCGMTETWSSPDLVTVAELGEKDPSFKKRLKSYIKDQKCEYEVEGQEGDGHNVITDDAEAYSARPAMAPHHSMILLDGSVYSVSESDLTKFIKAERRYRWLSSFYRLDPRYQILTFFNDVSREGGNNIGLLQRTASQHMSLLPKHSEPQDSSLSRNPMLNEWTKVFNKASAFSVWRPTSLEAIRLLMEGKAVGKGLDVKGKSAKRGDMSGFIPFVQISKESDKSKVRRPPRHGRIRVYWRSRTARDEAHGEFTTFAADVASAIADAREILDHGDDYVFDEDALEEAMEIVTRYDSTDPSVLFLMIRRMHLALSYRSAIFMSCAFLIEM